MKLPRILSFAALGVFALATFVQGAETSARKKVLFFSKSSGFEHDAIKLKMKDGREGYGFPVLREIGEKQNIEFTFSKDGSLFTPEYLAQFDAFFFYTTGDLTVVKSDPRGDSNPPMTPAGKAALLQAIKNGKGFIGTHSAADTFHSFGRQGHVPERFLDDGDKADDYIKMLGGEFIRHGKQQITKLTVADAKFPGIAAVPADWSFTEEWYSLKNFAPDLHVLLVQETKGMVGDEYVRAAYPSTWVHPYGKGRVFYTNLGHREDVWTSPAFQSVLIGGLNWALSRVDADITPNLAKVAPKANVLPLYVEPAAKPARAAAPAATTP